MGPEPSRSDAARAGAASACRRKARIVSLDRTRILIWATPRGQNVAYEVTQAVEGPLQARCASAPLCPGDKAKGDPGAGIDPGAQAHAECPYAFDTRGECIRTRNAEALEAALFRRPQADLLSNYLKALGYVVRLEEVSPASLSMGMRILNAHARIRETHEVRVLAAPGGAELVLVRDLADAPAEDARRALARSPRRGTPGVARRARDRARGSGPAP